MSADFRPLPIALALLLTLPAALAASEVGDRPAAFLPSSKEQVLERLPASFATLARPLPQQPSLQTATTLLDVAARSGDARLAARAERELARFPPDDSAPVAVLLARAWAAQHRHDFALALRLLDGAIAAAPRDPAPRSLRAQIHVVQGRLGAARADCAALVVLDVSAALLCGATVSARRGETELAIRAVDRWLENAPADSGTLRHVYTFRAELAARLGEPDVESWFARALQLAPDDVRTLAPYARHLRLSDRPAAVLALLAPEPESDRLLLERALAAHAAQVAEAPALIGLLRERYAQQRRVGAESEAREEAEFWLRLGGDAPRALALALGNLQTQRDLEDVALAREAAQAARAPEALRELAVWAAREQVSLDLGATKTMRPGAVEGRR